MQDHICVTLPFADIAIYRTQTTFVNHFTHPLRQVNGDSIEETVKFNCINMKPYTESASD